MRLLSILARVGLVFLGAVLVTAVSADVVWEDSSDEVLTTSDLFCTVWRMGITITRSRFLDGHGHGWSGLPCS